MATIFSIITCVVFLATIGTLVFISNSDYYQEDYQNECSIVDYEIVTISSSY